MKSEVEVGGPDPNRLQGVPDGRPHTLTSPVTQRPGGSAHTLLPRRRRQVPGNCDLGHQEGDRQPALLKAGCPEHKHLPQAALFTSLRAPEDWPQVSPLGLAGAAPPSSGL